MLQLLLNLILGIVLISMTVVIHTFGLMSVTHTMSWITSHVRLHGHRSRILAMNTVVIGVFAVLTAEVWLWAICYRAIGFIDDYRRMLEDYMTRLQMLDFVV